MGIFDDKKFESLDWISQATEPIDSKLNEILAAIPEEFIIDFEQYRRFMTMNSSLEFNIESIVSYCATRFFGESLTWEQRGALVPCFEINMDKEVLINFENKTMIGSIKLVKIQSTMDEKVLEGLLGKEGIDSVSWMVISHDGLSRANDVMEILTKCEAGLKTRSHSKKRHIIKNRLIQLFKANEWKIKDTELANKVGFWITCYVAHGNLAAWANFCKLKLMTHKDQPIYSMEEVK